MAARNTPALAHQFDDLAQQHEADTLGMWTFLMTEMLLFGGLFLAYAVYRTMYPEAWAEGAHHQHIAFGSINTAILLFSSLTMALAVRAAEDDQRKATVGFLLATIGLGIVFLGIKFYEYYSHYHHDLLPGMRFHVEGKHAPQVALYFIFYYAMTGLHAIHMLIGIGVVGVMAFLVHRGRLAHHKPVEITGLYWHLIDIVWVFLFPLLYLV